MSMYLDGRYLEGNPTWHEEHSEWKASHIASILKDNGVDPRTLAEIGCGAGQILVELERKLPRIERLAGFEISPQAFARCSQKQTERVQFQNIDVLTAPPAQPFDVAMAIDVFEHVDDYIGFIKKLRAVGKQLIFHIPLELSVSSMVRPATLRHARESVGHIHYFTRETALATLRHAGLEIVDERFTSVSIDHAEEFRTKLLSIPRRAIFAMAPDFAARLFGGFSLLVLAR